MADNLNTPDPGYVPANNDSALRTETVHPVNPVPYRLETEPLVSGRDTVRWGPIFAGLFTAISTLVVLGLLGLAIGFSTMDSSDTLRSFGIGAGWWGAISVLLAFMVGGYVAGCSAAIVRNSSHGAINGMMVWAVAIPMMLFLLTGGVASMVRTAGTVAGTAAEAAAPAVADVAPDSPEAVINQAQSGLDTLRDQGTTVVEQLRESISPEQVEEMADTAGAGAWGTLISLLVALAAAVIGGVIGAKARESKEKDKTHTTVRT